MSAPLSIIICTKDRPQLLGKCVDALVNEVSTSDEILIVEDAASAAAQPARRSVRVLRAPRPGLSHARNHGLAAAMHAWVAYVDDDACVAPGWRRAVENAILQSSERVACIGGPVEPDWAIERPPWLTREVEIWFTVWDPGAGARESGDDSLFCGANMIWKKDALLALGGFDPALGRQGRTLLSHEESAIWTKLRADGGFSRFEPNARVRHYVPKERMSPGWLLNRLYWEGISMMRATPPPHRLRGAVARAFRLAARPGDFFATLRFLCGNGAPLRACHVAYKLGEIRELFRSN